MPLTKLKNPRKEKKRPEGGRKTLPPASPAGMIEKSRRVEASRKVKMTAKKKEDEEEKCWICKRTEKDIRDELYLGDIDVKHGIMKIYTIKKTKQTTANTTRKSDRMKDTFTLSITEGNIDEVTERIKHESRTECHYKTIHICFICASNNK